MSFASRVAIVTGGASGIGLAMATELRKRGAHLVLVDVQEQALKAASEALHAEPFLVDVRDMQAMREVARQTAEKHGRIDFIFNNAGVAAAGEVKDTPLEEWDRIIDINIRGVVHGIEAVYPLMIEQGYGHIVNTASIAGLLACPGMVAYSASKHAIVGLSKGLRQEAARYGVRVSAVCPGFVRTPILENIHTFGVKREKIEKGLPFADVDECAVEILDGVLKNRGTIVVTRHGKILTQVERLAPSAMRLMGKMLQTKRA